MHALACSFLLLLKFRAPSLLVSTSSKNQENESHDSHLNMISSIEKYFKYKVTLCQFCDLIMY